MGRYIDVHRFNMEIVIEIYERGERMRVRQGGNVLYESRWIELVAKAMEEAFSKLGFTVRRRLFDPITDMERAERLTH